jgi:hypothetical protein
MMHEGINREGNELDVVINQDDIYVISIMLLTHLRVGCFMMSKKEPLDPAALGFFRTKKRNNIAS